MITPEQLVLLFLWYAVFLLSVTFHEAAHAFAAYKGGDPTAYLGGQVTLNPLPHIRREPFGTILAPLISYLFFGWMMGWASAPYDPFWEDRHPKRAAVMAAAGPLANLMLALLAFAVLKVGLATGTWAPTVQPWPPETAWLRPNPDQLVVSTGAVFAMEGLGRLCSVMLVLNLVLFLFNMFPLPPMDGASVLGGLLRPAREWLHGLRNTPFLGVLIAILVFRYLFDPLYTRVIVWLWS